MMLWKAPLAEPFRIAPPNMEFETIPLDVAYKIALLAALFCTWDGYLN